MYIPSFTQTHDQASMQHLKGSEGRTSCLRHGYELSCWGTSCLGYGLPWVRVV